MRLSAIAPAKVNLTLHVTGQRADGYHLLDSLVVFAQVGDQLKVLPGQDLRLNIGGPFAQGVPGDDRNLVLRAARALARLRGVDRGAVIQLDKHLPHAAGLGGGSSDAAAALTLLAQFWQVAPLPADAPEALALGADVPACLHGPGPLLLSGIGEVLHRPPALPDCALVLVNPRQEVATPEVFAALAQKDNPAMDALPEGLDLAGFAAWLSAQRNDLLDPARALVPEIDRVLDRLRQLPAVKAVGMSGSGATCWALVPDMAAARLVARAVQVAEMGWWVAPGAVGRM